MSLPPRIPSELQIPALRLNPSGSEEEKKNSEKKWSVWGGGGKSYEVSISTLDG